MRILAQRVNQASVSVDDQVVGSIGRGFLILVGIGAEDLDAADDVLASMAGKLLNLRVFPDEGGRMNRSLLESGGEILAVSQFTLHADCRRGRRPSFTRAAPPEKALELFERFVELLRAAGPRVATGSFGAMMQVSLVNDGPITIWLDSVELLN